jgi:hypothetical protein
MEYFSEAQNVGGNFKNPTEIGKGMTLEEDVFELGSSARPRDRKPPVEAPSVAQANSAAKAGFTDMGTTIDKLIRKLWAEATEIQDEYMGSWKLGNRIAAEKNLKPGFVQVYVRMHKGCLEISWKRHTGRRNESGMRQTEYIRKGSSDRYPSPSLKKHCQPWEWEIVREFEERLSDIRACYSNLSKMRSALKKSQKAFLKVVEREKEACHV